MGQQRNGERLQWVRAQEQNQPCESPRRAENTVCPKCGLDFSGAIGGSSVDVHAHLSIGAEKDRLAVGCPNRIPLDRGVEGEACFSAA